MFSEELLSSTPYEIVEALPGLKSLALIIKFHKENGDSFGLYRPEQGVMLSVDPRIPKPRELYLDCAFSDQCLSLGWDHVVPVYEWSLEEGDRGVIRPYWPKVGQMQIYHFKKEKLLAGDAHLWKQIAVADYVFGVGDRVSNDFLVTEDGIKVADSGYSFLPGLDFVGQQSIVRECLLGESIESDEQLLSDLEKISSSDVNSPHLTDENKYWVTKRAEEILKRKVII